MTERPIPMNGAMVRATLREDDPKTQTRRVLKQATGPSLSVDCDGQGAAELSWLYGDGPGHDVHERMKRVLCPYGAPGDRLWVRETWRVSSKHDAIKPRDLPFDRGLTIMYDAGGSRAHDESGKYVNDANYPASLPDWAGKGRPSIHMPRAASRVLLEVAGVRVERLQDISEADAIAEGCQLDSINPCGWFGELWDSLAASGADWQANPWVWVVEFRRIV
jgi:hypothetical protein